MFQFSSIFIAIDTSFSGSKFLTTSLNRGHSIVDIVELSIRYRKNLEDQLIH